MERLYFLAKVEEGLRQAEAGQTVSHEEAEATHPRVTEVRWTDQAVEDLRSIREFIERDSPMYGRPGSRAGKATTTPT